MNGLYVRNAHEDERDAIRDMALAAYEQYGSIMPPPAWEGYQQNIQQTLKEVELNECIVAVQDTTIVGSVLLYPAKENTGTGVLAGVSWPEIRLLATKPEVRGQGIGRALMDECIQRTRAAGFTLLGLHTTDMMQIAQNMYIGMGFVHHPELDFHPGPDVVVKGYLLRLDTV